MVYLKRKNIMEINRKILVSACLLGEKCRYNGEHSLNKALVEELRDKKVLSCCPEIVGGLPTPRSACNIHGGDGSDVLIGKASIIGKDGKDYTKFFVEGAELVLEKAVENGVKEARLKANSPSCGYGKIYSADGSKLIDGNGVLSELLEQNGIEIKSL